LFPGGTNTVVVTAVDASGNSNTCAFEVVVSVYSAGGLSPAVTYGPVITNGEFVVRFSGIPSYTYTIEAADDLELPDWTKKVNLTAPATDQGLGVGVFEFRESVGTAASRFYRTVFPSY